MSLLSFTKKLTAREKAKTVKPVTNTTAPAPTAKLGVTGVAQGSALIPLISEKSVMSQSATNTAVFRADVNANKGTIAQAVRHAYGVTPVAVRTINMAGKRRRRGNTEGSTRAWKKAYVTLPAGSHIDFSA